MHAWFVCQRTDRAGNIADPCGMPSTRNLKPLGSAKTASGIAGFDEITGGGLPSGRTTLLAGGAGSGKTVFALQFAVHGARSCKEPGLRLGNSSGAVST